MKTEAKHPTLTTCLKRIAKGEWMAAGVLADYLEENDLPHAKRVRGMWNKMQQWGEVVNRRSLESQARRKQAKWERIAGHRRWLCESVLRIYHMDMKALPIRAFI